MTDFRTAASKAIKIPPAGLDVSTAAGLAKALSIGASECLQAARDLDVGFSDLTGEYIVTFHAIELGLKARGCQPDCNGNAPVSCCSAFHGAGGGERPHQCAGDHDRRESR